MRPLYESIKGNLRIGIVKTIDNWCKLHNVYSGDYEITDKLTIKRKSFNILTIVYDKKMDELPDYIKFEGGDDIILNIACDKISRVKSFRGLPSICRSCKINSTSYNTKLPELKMEVCLNFVVFDIASFDKLDLTFSKNSTKDTILKLRIRDWSNVKINGPLSRLDFVNDFYMGDIFSSAIARKADMNKYKNKFETPVKPEALDVIEEYIGKIMDTSTLTEIDYTQNSKLVKHEGKWYRFKNW